MLDPPNSQTVRSARQSTFQVQGSKLSAVTDPPATGKRTGSRIVRPSPPSPRRRKPHKAIDPAKSGLCAPRAGSRFRVQGSKFRKLRNEPTAFGAVSSFGFCHPRNQRHPRFNFEDYETKPFHPSPMPCARGDPNAAWGHAACSARRAAIGKLRNEANPSRLSIFIHLRPETIRNSASFFTKRSHSSRRLNE